jgi:hypothetical protein
MRIIMACSVLVVLFCVSQGNADLVKPREAARELVLPAGLTRSYVDAFKKNERAVAMARGVGLSCMGLYVFDSHGNCLAMDDLSSRPTTADDLIVTWYPAEQDRFCVELRNTGFDANEYQIALK